MAGGFLSTRNDLRLALVFMVFMVIIIFSVETIFYNMQTAQGSAGGGGGGPPGGEEEGPQYTLGTVEALSATGQTSEGQTSTEEFGLSYDRVDEVRAELTWTDDIGNNDVFRVTLVREGVPVGSQEGDRGHISFSVTDAPGGGLFGNYTVEVEAVRCPGAFEGSPLDRDGGNSWELRISADVGTLVEEEEGGA